MRFIEVVAGGEHWVVDGLGHYLRKVVNRDTVSWLDYYGLYAVSISTWYYLEVHRDAHLAEILNWEKL